MAVYRMLRMGNTLQPYNQGSTPNKDRDAAIEGLRKMMPNSIIQLEEYECDCVEKMATQDTFTKQELFQILHCPVNH